MQNLHHKFELRIPSKIILNLVRTAIMNVNSNHICAFLSKKNMRFIECLYWSRFQKLSISLVFKDYPSRYLFRTATSMGFVWVASYIYYTAV